jgi:hypothetical protein
MTRLALALAVAITLAVSASAATSNAKPQSSRGPSVPTDEACHYYSGDYLHGGGGNGHLFFVTAYAQWCWNTSTNRITRIWDTLWYPSDNTPYCSLQGQWHGLDSGGVGYTWYTTYLGAWWYCSDGHDHGWRIGWAHNGWGNSGIAWDQRW